MQNDKTKIYCHNYQESYIPKIIGQNGSRIAEIEKEIGISLGVEVLEKEDNHAPKGKQIPVDIFETKKQVILDLRKDNGGRNFDVFVDGDYLLTATTSKKGEIKIKKGVELADRINDGLELNSNFTATRK